MKAAKKKKRYNTLIFSIKALVLITIYVHDIDK